MPLQMDVTVKEDRKKEKLLRLLTYEVVDGRPIYYRGYRDVLEGKKQPEEVMGSSVLQWSVLKSLVKLLLPLEGKGYILAFGEVGLHLGKGRNRSLDLAVFVSKVDLSEKYADTPPVLVVEIDVKAEVDDKLEYITGKSEELLTFGTKKVVWILTRPRKVLMFEKGKRPIIYDWEDEIHLLEDVKLRLSDIVKRP